MRLSLSVWTFFALLSTQTTSFPLSARQVPVTSPTYPVPTTATFMVRILSRSGGDFPPVVQDVSQGLVEGDARRPPGRGPELPRVGPGDGRVRPAARLDGLADVHPHRR